VRPDPLARQKQAAVDALKADLAGSFFKRLKIELERDFPCCGELEEVSDIMNFIGSLRENIESNPDEVKKPLWAVRRALRNNQDSVPCASNQVRVAEEKAATALYFFCACCLVNQKTRKANGYVIAVQPTQSLVYAVIATALFGGELRVKADDGNRRGAEYIFEVKVPAAGQHPEAEFERAVYMAMIRNSSEAPSFALDTRPLDSQQRNRLSNWLSAQFDDIRNVARSCFAVVVRDGVPDGSCDGFAAAHKVPVFLHNPAAQKALLGMEEDRLADEIDLLWREIAVPDIRHRQQREGQNSGAITGPVTSDPVALAKALNELIALIQALPAAPVELTQPAKAAAEEMNKKNPDYSAIKNFLDKANGMLLQSLSAIEKGSAISVHLSEASEKVSQIWSSWFNQ